MLMVLFLYFVVCVDVKGKFICFFIGSVFILVCRVISGFFLFFLSLVIILVWVIFVWILRFNECKCLVMYLVVLNLWLLSFGYWCKWWCYLMIFLLMFLLVDLSLVLILLVNVGVEIVLISRLVESSLFNILYFFIISY